MTETAVATIPQDKFNVAKLSEITLPETWDDAVAVIALLNGGQEIDNASDVLADEWPVIEKAKLVNVPFLAVTWSVSAPESSETGQYLVVRGMTRNGNRFRFADGSTGIMKQLVKLTWDRTQEGHPSPNAGLVCENGLTVSKYNTTDAAGKPISAETYYIGS